MSAVRTDMCAIHGAQHKQEVAPAFLDKAYKGLKQEKGAGVADAIGGGRMNLGHRVLVAAQPQGWRALQTMLADVADLVPAHTTADAFKILEQERIDLIVSTIAFDESRMLEFLQAVKQTSSTSGIPFLCSRVLPGVIRDNLVIALRDACKESGACDFVDVARLAPGSAQVLLRSAVEGCLRQSPGAPQAH